MKRRLWLLLAVVIIAQFVLALGVSAAAENQIQPLYLNTHRVSVTLVFSGEQGYASCRVEGIDGVTKIDSTLTIYRKNFWGQWVETGYSWDYSVADDIWTAYVPFEANSGTEYKAELTASVLKGIWEDVEATDIKECP